MIEPERRNGVSKINENVVKQFGRKPFYHSSGHDTIPN